MALDKLLINHLEYSVGHSLTKPETFSLVFLVKYTFKSLSDQIKYGGTRKLNNISMLVADKDNYLPNILWKNILLDLDKGFGLNLILLRFLN